MKFSFSTKIVVEASSQEDALSQVATRIGTIARHLANGEALADAKPFFKLTEALKGEVTDLRADPIVARRLDAERDGREREIISLADVGRVTAEQLAGKEA